MAKGTKFGRAVGWGAGIGLSNWLLRKRTKGPTQDAHIQVPPPALDHDVKAEVYRLRGETVSIGGMVEWIVATLASRFAQSKKKNPRAQWNDLKRHIKSRSLKEDLLNELGAVNGYFKPRNLAAHTGTVITGVAEATRVFRLSRDRSGFQVDLVTVDELQEETATAKAGYDAIQAIGRALDDDDPTVLADMNELTKGILLDRI